MELGISPIVTSSMISQLFIGLKLLEVGETPAEKALFEAVQKLLGFIITFVQSIFYVMSGMYGTPAEIGAFRTLLLIFQLNISGMIVVLLDELISKGYGFGSGLNLFIATNVCENIVWRTLSPKMTETIQGNQFEGALIQYLAALTTGHGGSNRFTALVNAVHRSTMPGLYHCFATFVVFAVAIYFQGFKVDINIQHSKVNTQRSTYPIKLFYTSTTPIMLHSTLLSNLFMMSQMIYNRYPSSIISQTLGQWSSASGSHAVPVGGLCYYMNRPEGVQQVMEDPLQCLAYMVFMLVSCAFFSKTWLAISGSQAKDIAKQLKSQQMIIAGYREHSSVAILNRYIPIAASFGGLCIGALSIFADFSGALGSGTSILLAVSIVSNLQEMIQKEQNESGGQSIMTLLMG